MPARMDDRLAEELAAVGVDPGKVRTVETLSLRHGHRVVRVGVQRQSFILKTFPSEGASEISVYRLLGDLRVPTLTLHGSTGVSLLLEDLAASAVWRAAVEDDLRCSKTGEAVARWYRTLHCAGRQVGGDPPPFLGREVDVLNRDRITALARELQLEAESSMKLAAESIEVLKDGMGSLPQTLNYTDFYWTNLALSRQGNPRRAVVYDYHLMGVGPACCDLRNVLSTLTGVAAAAFTETYGPVPEAHFILDRPLATLTALHQAALQSALPVWAQDAVRQVESGEFEDSLRAALSVL